MYPQPMPRYTPYATSMRSGIPRVVGIIAIVFAVIGIGSSVLFTWGPLDDFGRRAHKLGMVHNWLYIWMFASVVLFFVHLAGGILATMYRQTGLRLLTGYAVGALVLIVLDLILLYGFTSGHRATNSLVIPRTFFAVLAAPWPIIVLCLVNSRRARDACDQGPKQYMYPEPPPNQM